MTRFLLGKASQKRQKVATGNSNRRKDPDATSTATAYWSLQVCTDVIAAAYILSYVSIWTVQ